jgi:NADH-quinone oxidoreductase subunit H
MSSLIVIFFLGGWLPIFEFTFFIIPNYFWFSFKVVFIVFLFILIRAMLPRYRYDQLMSLGWKVFLPLSLGFLIFYSGILYGLDWLP